MAALTYDAVGLDLERLARDIKHEHETVERALRDSLAHARRAGELLLEAKDKLPHGVFMQWVEANCAFAHRTATLYMQIAREWERVAANWQSLANLGVAAAARWLTSCPWTQ